MDPITRQVVQGAAGAGGIEYAGYDVSKAGEYLIVPFSSGSTYDVLFVDSTTGEVEERIPDVGYRSDNRIFRFGTNILFMNYFGHWELWSALTLAQLASGSVKTPFGYTFLCDQVKIDNDKILVLGWENTSGNTTCEAYTFYVDTGTTLSYSGLQQITSNTATNMGVRNSTYGMINNPVIGGQASVNSNTGTLSAPVAMIGTKAPNNGSSAPAARGSISVNSSGTSISFNGSTNYNSNYSRPVAGTGGNGYCLISGMDGAEVHIFSGSGPGSQIPGNGAHHAPTPGYSPAAVLSVSHWLTITQGQWPTYVHAAVVINIYGVSTTWTIGNSGGSSIHSIPGGAAVVYVDGTDVKIKKYLASGSWQTPITVTLLPGPVTANSVNNSYSTKKIINY